MNPFPRLVRDDSGATMVEMAFAFPVFVMLIYMIFQLGLVFRANSGIQHALGEGARYATLYPTPTDPQIKTKMDEAVYGIGPGVFNNVVTPNTTDGYRDLTVTYTQSTSLLLMPGPNISLTKTKRVWVAD